jgi:hypothetical protein
MNKAEDANRPHLGGLFDFGRKFAPATTRFVFGAYLVLAVSSVVLSWRFAPSILVATSFGVVLLAVISTLLARAAVGPSVALPAQVLLWAVVVALLFSMGLFISAAFLGLPRGGAIIVARILNAPELLAHQGRTDLITLDHDTTGWPLRTTQAPDVSTDDPFARLDKLTQQPSLRVENTALVSTSPNVFVYELDLSNGTIVTNGGNLTIEAVRIISNGGVIRSFGSPPTADSNQAGKSGGRVTLIVHDRIVGRLAVDLSGGPGAQGQAGRPGARGRDGSAGENAASSLFDCSHGAGRGGDGLAGERGGDGGPGLPGGSGGVLSLQGDNKEALSRAIAFSANGGAGGGGGIGGAGGLGGSGGPGGSPRGLCSGGGASGANGPPGANGIAGPAGRAGENGTMIF